MRDLYSDDYESVVAEGDSRFLPEGARKLAGAMVFLGLVGALGLWSYRLGTRDAAEVPIIRAMEGPARIEPAEPGGSQAAHQGLEVNAVLAGQAAPVARSAPEPARPAPEALTAEDAPQGELVLSAPAILAERVIAEAGDPAVPPSDVPQDFVAVPLAADPLHGDDAVTLDASLDTAVEDVLPAVAPGPRPMNRPRNLVVARTKTQPVSTAASPQAAAPAKAGAPAAAPAAREVASVKTGTRLVQLGAYDSEEITRRAWARLVSSNPDLLSSKSLYVERTTSNARVFYRLRVAGFENTEQTRVMCESLRARGIDCIPVTLQ